jgi:hypothetical protein
MLIETLASYDQITPMLSLEGIQESIAEVLADQDNPDHQVLAQGIVASMFEDERILGPYSEAVDSLPEQKRLMLFAMSVLAPDHSFIGTPYALRHLADGVRSADGIVARALARYAGAVPDDTMMRQEVVASHLHGLQGWAKIMAVLPPADPQPAEPLAIGWRLVDELLLGLFRGDIDAARAEAIWQQLITGLPGETTVIMYDIYWANPELVNYGDMKPVRPYGALLDTYPEQVRRLLESALVHRDTLTAAHGGSVWNLGSYVVRALGDVGTAQTADLLRHHYIHDAELGRSAIAAVHAIDARTQT